MPSSPSPLRTRLHFFLLGLHSRLGHIVYWRFWPGWLFFLPVALYYFFLALRYRSLTLPSATNPGLINSGLVGDSKSRTLAQLQRAHPGYTAPFVTITFSRSASSAERFEELQRRRKQLGLENVFPFVLKPDNGRTGAGVKIVRDGAQAREFCERLFHREGVDGGKKTGVNGSQKEKKEAVEEDETEEVTYILQRFSPGPHEAGVFYVRHPSAQHGQILDITSKRFPVLTGDGAHTLSELLLFDPRARFLHSTYLSRLSSSSSYPPSYIPPAGASIPLVNTGNRSQGCIFVRGTSLLTPSLTALVDSLSRSVEGFYIGRFDVRYSDPAALMAGKPAAEGGLEIVELNGAGALAMTWDDPETSLWSAWGILMRVWRLEFQIGAENERRGVRVMGVRELWAAVQKDVETVGGYGSGD